MTMFTAMQGHCSRALRAAAAALVGAGAISPAIAWAQEDYPSRPIEIVVPFSPGGSGEMSARIIQTAMEEVLGQPIVVVARPGAATNIGTFSVVQAEPDGYTLLMGATALTANPHIYSSLEFDPLTDLIPISIVINSPLMLAANPALGAQDVADVTRIATERPGELNFASSGVGSSAHLNGEFFTYTAGLNIQHIPYSGGGPAMQAALSGEVDLISSNVTNLQGLVENGDLVPIGVAAAERSPMLPEVPTFREQGVDYELGSWFGLFAPAGTPQEIIDLLADAVEEVLQRPEVLEAIAERGAQPGGMDREEFAAFLRKQTDGLGRVIEAAGITAE